MKLSVQSLVMQGWWDICPEGLFLRFPDDLCVFLGPGVIPSDGRIWRLADAIKHYLGGITQAETGYFRITIEKLDEPSPTITEIATEICVEE